MYCKKCGSRMGQNDSFCRVCGEVASEENNTKRPEVSGAEEFTADTEHSAEKFSTGDKDNIKEETSKDDGALEFTWNVYEFPRPKKTEDVDFHWDIEDEKKNGEDKLWRELENNFPQENPWKTGNSENAENLEEEIFRDMSEESEEKRGETNFFTFTKKNEEFQKLLDREYEKVRGKRPVKPPAPLSAAEEEKRRGINRNTIPINPHKVAEAQAAAAIKEVPVLSEREIQQAKESLEAAMPERPENEEKAQLPEPGNTKNTEEIISPEPFITEAKNKELPLSCISSVQEKSEKPKNRRAGRILLIALIIVLALEVGAIGVQHFFPDTAAGQAISKFQKTLVSGIFKLGNSSQDKKTDKIDSSSKEDASEPEPPVTDTIPAADKDALIASQMERNKNIQAVRFSAALGYRQEKNYGLPSINRSVPLENNLLTMDGDGNPVYIDQQVVGTLIAFDSQWIDYVNEGNPAVFNLLEEGSAAYKNSKAYSQVGKIKETFVLLEIGEIRQGADGFYVWTHEQIQIEKNGRTQSKEYYWIYLLKASGGQMKIADYKRY